MDTCVSPYGGDEVVDKMTEVLFHTPGCFLSTTVTNESQMSTSATPTQPNTAARNSVMIQTLFTVEPLYLDVRMHSPSPMPQSRKRKRSDDDHDTMSPKYEEVEVTETRMVRKSPRVQKLSYKLQQIREMSLSLSTPQSTPAVENVVTPLVDRRDSTEEAAEDPHGVTTTNQSVRRSARTKKVRDYTTPRRLSLRSHAVFAPANHRIDKNNHAPPLVSKSTPRAIVTRLRAKAAVLTEKPVPIYLMFGGVRKKRSKVTSVRMCTRTSKVQISPWTSALQTRSTMAYDRKDQEGCKESRRKRRKIDREEEEVWDEEEKETMGCGRREASVDLYTGQPVTNVNTMDVEDDDGDDDNGGK